MPRSLPAPEIISPKPGDKKVTHLFLNPLSGGADFDGQPGDDGLRVVIEPRNATDEFVPEAGALSVVLLDPERQGESARVARWDSDVASRKGGHEAIVRRLEAGEIDILVGTQVLAKGLDLPEMTVVGVVDADVGMNLPDFHAHERAYQLLSQVAGRAGRRDREGFVFIQTYEPGLAPVLRSLSVFPALTGLVLVQQAQLRRELQFRALAIRHIVSAVSGAALGIAMAALGYGVWSLVAQMLGGAVVGLVILWRASTWRPRLAFSAKHLRELSSFGVSVSRTLRSSPPCWRVRSPISPGSR